MNLDQIFPIRSKFSLIGQPKLCKCLHYTGATVFRHHTLHPNRNTFMACCCATSEFTIPKLALFLMSRLAKELLLHMMPPAHQEIQPKHRQYFLVGLLHSSCKVFLWTYIMNHKCFFFDFKLLTIDFRDINHQVEHVLPCNKSYQENTAENLLDLNAPSRR